MMKGIEHKIKDKSYSAGKIKKAFEEQKQEDGDYIKNMNKSQESRDDVDSEELADEKLRLSYANYGIQQLQKYQEMR